jgi:hypothetical protein
VLWQSGREYRRLHPLQLVADVLRLRRTAPMRLRPYCRRSPVPIARRRVDDDPCQHDLRGEHLVSGAFRYRSFVSVADLAIGECTIHRAAKDGAGKWWLLWMRITRNDGVPEDIAVPVSPGGHYAEDGPGGKTWGFNPGAAGTWIVSPSINVLETSDLHPGDHPKEVSVWHENVTVEDVPADVPWTGVP